MSTSSITLTPDNIIKVYSLEESKTINQQWCNVYCKNKDGISIKNYKWHIFSSGAYPSIESTEAEKLFHEQSAPELIVLDNCSEEAVLTSSSPVNCNLSDYYV